MPQRNLIAHRLFVCISMVYAMQACTLSAYSDDKVPEENEPLRIGTRTCLFLDDRYIAEMSGLQRTWHQGTPQPEPAITTSQPWENWLHMFGSVIHDEQEGLYKMWYEGIPSRGAVLYAESTDGKKWTKPTLNLVELMGSTENNCVLYGAELPNVFLDPRETDHEARFKMFAWGGPFGEQKTSGHVLFSSADGKRWKLIGNYNMPSPTDESGQARIVRDTNLVIWDELAERYLGTFRTFPLHPGLIGWMRDEKYQFFPFDGGYRRGVGITTSNSLRQGWTPIRTMLKADARDDEKVHAISKTDDPDFAELYTMPIFVYGNHYLGVVSLLFQVDATEETMSNNAGLKRADIQPGGSDMQLTFSHDGMHWQRQPDRQTLFGPSPAGLVPVYTACNAPLEIGDELWMYYTEAESAHPAPDDQSLIRAAVWRKDGFVSLDADESGMLETKTIIWEGDRLRINIEPRESGSVRVALLDADGQVLPGYDLADCDPLEKDDVAVVVSWNGKSDLSALRGKAIRLRFAMKNCAVYAFRGE